MRDDVIQWAQGRPTAKLPSKETLNHPDLLRLVTGLDPYADTPTAFVRAYEALGIDIINRVPLTNAPPATPPGAARPLSDRPYTATALGVYDTFTRTRYAVTNPDDVWNLDVTDWRYEDLIVPVPHPCTADDVARREAALGPAGMYYPMLYTTLFMWPVEVLGWEVFLLAAIAEPDRFHEHVLVPCARHSRRIVETLAAASTGPFVFVHDDLADANGPIFPPAWYDEHIFPLYPIIFEPARRAGKKIVVVADGNMTAFLPRLVDAGVDGFMGENPATPIEACREHFGAPGRFYFGGIETARLTFGTPEDIARMVRDTAGRFADAPGFALSSCGGLHGNIPLDNLAAYFDARVDVAATPPDWRHRMRQGVA